MVSLPCPNAATSEEDLVRLFKRTNPNSTDEKALKELARSFNLQARGMGGEHSAMDANGTADISPSARFGVTEAIVTNKLFEGLKKLYEIELK